MAEDVNLDMGRVASGAPIPIDIRMRLVTAPGSKPLPLAAQFKLTLDLARQRYELADLALSGTVQPAGAPGELDWKLGMPSASVDLNAQTLAETVFTAEVGAASLGGSIAGTKLIDAPALAGRFELKELAPRELMQQFGIVPPVTRDNSCAGAICGAGRLCLAGRRGPPERPQAAAG